MAVALDDNREAKRLGMFFCRTATTFIARKRCCRLQDGDKWHGKIGQFRDERVTQAAFKSQGSCRLMQRDETIRRRELLEYQARDKRNAMKLADTLQPPYISLSRQQQFGSQRRTPLSGVDVSRLAPESGRGANQITNISFLRDSYRLTAKKGKSINLLGLKYLI